MKGGSLFDGIGGWPLAGRKNVIEFVWASENDQFPISITKKHFPTMKHLGDITKINGADVEPVDVITFGSPCQDLSVAGKRGGLDGERSGLFREAIRIIREMRFATNNRFPRFAVWENVPGAFSSNKGIDFRTVLEEIAETTIPMPASGRWAKAGMVRGNGRETAWRTLDAQYWGVPQRRKRIFLVADFGGQCAGEILFKPEGVCRNTQESEGEREGVAGGAKDSTRTTGGSKWCMSFAAKLVGSMVYTADNVAQPLLQTDYKEPQVVIYPVVGFDAYQHHKWRQSEVLGPLTAAANFRGDTPLAVSREIYRARKLTPTECERLQGLPNGWTDGGYKTQQIDLISEVEEFCKKKIGVQFLGVNERNKQLMGIALCTIKDIRDMEKQNYLNTLLKDANIVIEKLSQERCVIGTIKTGKGMEMPSMRIRLDKELMFTDTEKQAEFIKLNIEKLWLKNSEENSQEKKLSTILTLISSITTWITYTSALANQNIRVCINNLTLSRENLLSWELSVLEKVDIVLGSDTQRYKALGNGMAQPCPDYIMEGIANILKG